jgi:hypothetical protein
MKHLRKDQFDREKQMKASVIPTPSFYLPTRLAVGFGPRRPTSKLDSPQSMVPPLLELSRIKRMRMVYIARTN